jgi:hypothetical protein
MGHSIWTFFFQLLAILQKKTPDFTYKTGGS